MNRLCYPFLLLPCLGLAQAVHASSLIVVEDRGGVSALPYYQDLNPEPTAQSISASYLAGLLALTEKNHDKPNTNMQRNAVSAWVGEASQSMAAPLLRQSVKGSSLVTYLSWQALIAVLNSSAPSCLWSASGSPLGQAVNDGTV